MDTEIGARPSGAESNYYQSLDPPYAARDGLLRGFDELALVKGYTPDVMARLEPHVTAIWTGPDTGAAIGGVRHDKININTATQEVLTALHPEMGNLAERIVADRKDTPFTSISVSGLEQVFGLDISDIATQIAPLLTWKSDYFSVLASGAVGETRRTVRATLKRTVGGTGGRRTQVIAWRVE
jgi:general secretion pathway protein K